MEKILKEIAAHMEELNWTATKPNIHNCGKVTFATYLITNNQTLDEEVIVAKIWDDGQYRLYAEI